MASEVQLLTEFRHADLFERGSANTVRCPVYLDNALVACTSGTWQVLASTGAVLGSGAVTPDAGVATLTWTPASDVALSDTCQLLWTLALTGHGTRVFGNAAMVVLRRLACPISQRDLTRTNRRLNPADESPFAANDGWQEHIEEAWIQVQSRLIERGHRPHLILEPSALRECTREMALHLVFAELAVSQDGVFKLTADDHFDKFEDAWGRLTFPVAQPDGTGREAGRRAARPPVFLGRG